MPFVKKIFLFLISFVILLPGLSSCSSRTKGCMSDKTYRTHSYKKNKSGRRNPSDYKSKTVKKDYVIRNGIAR